MNDDWKNECRYDADLAAEAAEQRRMRARAQARRTAWDEPPGYFDDPDNDNDTIRGEPA